MIKNLLVICVILISFISNDLNARTYKVVGTAPEAAYQELSVFTYEDHFNLVMNFKKSTVIDAEGRFEFEIETELNTLLVLRIKSINSQFFLGESNVYEIEFNHTKATLPIKFTNTNWASVNFLSLSPSDINFRLEQLNKAHAQYYQNHSSDIYQTLTSPSSGIKNQMKKKGLKVDFIKEENESIAVNQLSMNDSLMDLFENTLQRGGFLSDPNAYVRISAKYMKAELESLLGKNTQEIYNEYLSEDFYPENQEFMSFFKTYFKNILEDLHGSDVYDNYLNKLYKLDLDSTLLEANKYLEIPAKETLKLALLSGIESGFNLPSISSRDVTLLLELLSRSDSSVGKMASNYRQELLKGKRTYVPEDCFFLDLEENKFSLSDLKGRFVYLSFFSSWNTESVGHQQKIKQLQSKYGNRIEFISICMDYDWELFRDFLIENRNYNWKFGFGNTDKLLKEKLNLSTVPHYIFLDPDGSFYLDYTPSPEEEIVRIFEKALRN